MGRDWIEKRIKVGGWSLAFLYLTLAVCLASLGIISGRGG